MQFEYQGVNQTGQNVSGLIDAADRASAVQTLARSGHFATELRIHSQSAPETVPDKSAPPPRSPWSRSVTGKDILTITAQLSTALRAGLPLLDGLTILRRQQHKASTRALLDELAHAVRGGESLSQALARRPRLFKPLYIAMIRVGETGGILEQTTEQLTRLLKRDEQVKAHMKTASVYPLIVLIVGIISVILVITFILPGIVNTIAETGAVLPLPTRILLAVNNLLRTWGLPLLALLILAALAFRRWTTTPSGRLTWDTFKLKIPVLGAVLRSLAVGRFTRTLGALTRGGVTILEALAVVRDTLGNERLALAVDDVAEKVKTGDPLAEPLARSGLFPPLLVQITSVGEQTGKLDELLLTAADTFDEEADMAVARFMAVLPAALVILLALIIGFIVVAMLLPIIVMGISAGGI